MRDIDELLNKPKPEKVLTPEEMNRKQYLEDVARMRDFRPEADRMRWPKPVGPLWKN